MQKRFVCTRFGCLVYRSSHHIHLQCQSIIGWGQQHGQTTRRHVIHSGGRGKWSVLMMEERGIGSSAVTVIQLHSIVAHLQECYSFECLSGMTMGFIRSSTSTSTSSPGSEQMRASGGFLAPGMEYGNNCILKDVTGTNIHSILRSSALVHLSVWLAGWLAVRPSVSHSASPSLLPYRHQLRSIEEVGDEDELIRTYRVPYISGHWHCVTHPQCHL